MLTSLFIASRTAGLLLLSSSHRGAPDFWPAWTPVLLVFRTHFVFQWIASFHPYPFSLRINPLDQILCLILVSTKLGSATCPRDVSSIL